jgi:hypothetical protein
MGTLKKTQSGDEKGLSALKFAFSKANSTIGSLQSHQKADEHDLEADE